MTTNGRRVRVHIEGIVQGVGFRPHVSRLAREYGLGGWVRNDSRGVDIEAAGEAGAVASFLADLTAKAPPLARILRFEVADQPYLPETDFRIADSEGEDCRATLICPDVSICPDCLRELLAPADRRFRYPFINCTNCGPRYSIIQDIPYDRDKTTMAGFAMCGPCRAEYEDPENRRYHAQPNACPACGPQVWLEDAEGRALAHRDEAVRKAVSKLAEGRILAVKGLGGFHLAALATDEAAVARLRTRKHRDEKPFAVMFADLETVKAYCDVGPEEEQRLLSPQRPIVILNGRNHPGGQALAASTAPGNRTVGAFLPYTPLHYLLFEGAPYKALVMTSGNASEFPMIKGNDEARDQLKEIADFFLFHDRDVHVRCDDSVERVVDGEVLQYRRGRGYAPAPILLAEDGPSVLGVGAELKSALCLTRGREAFVSQHIGDLKNLETFGLFAEFIAHLKKILEIDPALIVHDLHPDYISTDWAVKQKALPTLVAQHHHAHAAAVMAENGLAGPVLAVTLDGAGIGTDGTVWGGEILRVEGDRFERLGHLRQARLPGGDRASEQPWRMAVSWLWSIDPEGVETRFADILSRWRASDVGLILSLLRRGVNSPVTSSCGRLFDAAACLAGIRDRVSYEGQAAIELEQALIAGEEAYRGEVSRSGSLFMVDPGPMLMELVEDVRRSVEPGVISMKFHNGLAGLWADALERIRIETGLEQVVLSGGVFQNAYLSSKLARELAGRGFEVYRHRELPPNDACISLGQAWIGRRHFKRQESSDL